jgi:hypothetical protein
MALDEGKGTMALHSTTINPRAGVYIKLYLIKVVMVLYDLRPDVILRIHLLNRGYWKANLI